MPSRICMVALAALAGAAAPLQARRVIDSPHEFVYEALIGAGGSIEIRGVNGNLTAEESDGEEVEVVARKRGDRGSADEVRVTVIEHNGGATICALYPAADPDRPNRCGAGEDGPLAAVPAGVQVDFVVRVPRGVRFVGRTANGKVAAKAVSAGVEAHTLNGSIDLELSSGPVKASSVNGSIKATVLPGLRHQLEMATVNGDITVDLGPTSPRLWAETVNGEIEARVPLGMPEEISPTRLVAWLGGGEDEDAPEIKLRTVNGDIRLERRP